MIVALLWTGCKAEREDEPTTGDPFSLSICLPAEEVHAARMCSHRRALGDPGTAEQFALPEYIYVIIMKKADGDADWSLWKVICDTASTTEWTKKRYAGALPTTGDSIYEYNLLIRQLLSATRFDGRVYIIASAKGLTFDKALDGEHLDSQSAVESLRFASGDSIQENIQHIYSTPYNYAPNGEYYGFFSKRQPVPQLNLLLYHVAAKVDIKWHVADEARIKANPAEAVRLTYMKACNMFNGNAYCFKPMSNTAAGPVTSTDSVTIITPADEGLWWEGRSYFYTIPYTTPGRAGHFPLQMKMGTNDSTKYYKPTIYLNIESDTTFVPWLRVNFNLTQPLTEGSRDI